MFVLYDLVQLRIDENRSDQCVNARTIYSLKDETKDRASLLSLGYCIQL